MERILIINADDLGYDPEVTRGILQAMREGVVTSTTLMVNTPFSQEAAQAARGLAVGLHLNLARHAPMSSAFPQSVLEGGELSERRAGDLPAEAVEAEVLAQARRAQALLGAPPTHLDVHKHLHRHPNVLAGLLSAARRLDLPVRALDEPMRTQCRRQGIAVTAHFIGDAGAEPYWTFDRLLAQLDALQPGVTELMCHPGYPPSRVKSGYSTQRETELRTFCDPGARRELQSRGVRLADFRTVRSAA